MDREFKVGDQVYLKLQPYRQNTVAVGRNLKISTRYFGPFEVLERIGLVAYRLSLQEGLKVHPVFHVSLLKRSPPEGRPTSTTVTLTGDDGQLSTELVEILDRRMVRRGGKAVSQVLIRWSNFLADQTTWEDYWSLKSQFPNFDP